MPRNTKKRNRNLNNRSGLSAFLRRPLVQIGIVAIVALIVVAIALAGGKNKTGLAADVSADEAYQLVQNGAFLLDVRTQEEWDQYHATDAALIPLDQLQNRLGELPKDKQIVVICHTGNRSKTGRDILLSAGLQATSVTGGVLEWIAQGYPFEGTAPK